MSCTRSESVFSHIESAELLPRSFNMADTIINVKFVKEVQKYPCLYNADIAAYSRKDLTEEAWTKIGVFMNMTAIACKDKWRNLRVVFIRHLKQSALSDKKRKPYYLFDEMQFLIPYLKLNFSSRREESGECTNPLPQRHERISEKDDYNELKIMNNELIDDIKYELDDSSNDTYTENDNTQDLQIRKRTNDDIDSFNFRKYPRLEQTNESVTGQVDHSVLPNTSNKNVNLERTTYESVSQKNDPVVSFLNSILPELNEMNSNQFKKFKRRVLSLIDDIKPEYE